MIVKWALTGPGTSSNSPDRRSLSVLEQFLLLAGLGALAERVAMLEVSAGELGDIQPCARMPRADGEGAFSGGTQTPRLTW